MLDYMDVLGIPATVIIAIVAFMFVMQMIGGFLEFKGKTAPEIMRIRKYLKKRKEEHEIVAKVPRLMERFDKFIDEWNERYSDRSIEARDKWMKHVDERGEQNQRNIDAISSKLDKHNEYIVTLLIESRRNTIIDFASCVTDIQRSFTREQFNRVFRLYDEYEEIIESHGLTNGEVDIAYKIITEAYEKHTRNGTFIEDVRGW